ncbi:chlorite dismutase family protein [Bradyrhizobium barranii subsp. apii]|uniref:Chlorite dismutase family protein n=1 Tax=Bradyrhizobium barranii subsp. apii TaxID=2819348 RepID=A0A8T5VGC5_9BRAD|nr:MULTISPECIES: chlorite dismutase family protein [Bradyrhizobium]UPT89160.1 chlorite dismutase family protein [Bradyrhizobium barranii subsp. apii]UPT95075.1 chlorite dismutase family protein [Bradyrhizobium barranii subsp. apii]
MFRMFRGGHSGGWRVTSISPVVGEPLPFVPALSVTDSEAISLPLVPSRNAWRLVGVASTPRYTERAERQQLTAVQAELGRLEATSAALIPIRKSEAWWELTQEERRKIFEDKSHHIASTLRFLPAIARQLYHSRDLGGPFDFLTWFEFAPPDASLFEELVAMLRQTEEWSYVEHEIDVRLVKEVLSA